MASLILMTFLAVIALAIAIVPVTVILLSDARATPVDTWGDHDDRRLRALQLAEAR